MQKWKNRYYNDGIVNDVKMLEEVAFTSFFPSIYCNVWL